MLLTIDVGNTQTVVGLYPQDQRGVPGHEPFDHWRISTNANRTADEYALVLQEFLAFHGLGFEESIAGMAVSSVVPRVTAALRRMSERYLGEPPVVVETGVRTGLPILSDNPREVGADRIANAVGALDLFGAPVIVVDFGTAITVDAVSPKGEFLGGAILPGLEVSFDALFERAAALRRVELVEARRVIGRSTAEAIQSGAQYGYAALVDGLIARIEDELGARPTVVATGGQAGLVVRASSRIEHEEPWLTLHGLRIIFARNQR